jgi:hypothetical protein
MLTKSIRWSFVLLVSVALAGIVQAETPDISGKSWTMTGTVTANVKKVATYKQKGEFQMHIGPNVDEGLLDNEWKLIDSVDDELVGEYHERQDSPGKGIFHFSSYVDSLEEYLLAKADQAVEVKDDVDILAVQVDSETCYPRGKQNKKGISLAVKSKIMATLETEIAGQSSQNTVMVSIALKGMYQVQAGEQEVEGSHWLLAIDSRFNVTGLPPIRENDGSADLWLGPNEEKGLLPNEWLAVGEDGEVELTGTYTVNKNKISIDGLMAHFSVLIEEYIAEALYYDGVYDFTLTELELSNYKATGTIKPGKSLKINSGVKFTGAAYIPGEGEVTGRGAYSEMVIGVPY